jgi:hypothetical protein
MRIRTVIQRPQLTTSALKKCLQMADDLDYHFFDVGNFMGMCLKVEYGMEAVMTP